MIKIAKLHGLGNDYVYFDLVDQSAPEHDWPAIARRISNRNEGIGSDGLILILPGESCDFRMRVFNSDGSEAKMCGNGIRCLGKYVFDHGLTKKREIAVETLAGVRTLSLFGEHTISSARVGMGKPNLQPQAIPVRDDAPITENGAVSLVTVPAAGRLVDVHLVSMGNPHGVVYVADATHYPVGEVGPAVEHHPFFPDGVNVEFVEVLDAENLKVRVWERGSGETMACGTGACAAAVASHLVKGTSRRANVHLAKGHLLIEWDDDEVHMTGPAVEVFSGTLNPNWLETQ